MEINQDVSLCDDIPPPNGKGYIYIRDNELCQYKNIYKLGIATNIKSRNDTYITYEHVRGKFVFVAEVAYTEMRKIEACLGNAFMPLHNFAGGGKEYYNRAILDMIRPYLEKMEVEYKILTQEEIDLIERPTPKKNVCATPEFQIPRRLNMIHVPSNRPNPATTNKQTQAQEEDDTSDYSIEETSVQYLPRDYQEKIIETAHEYFCKNNKGILIIPCGVGKTLISLWITLRLNLESVLVGVPNKLLLKQWNNVCCSLFRETPCFIVKGGIHTNELTDFLEKNGKKCIVITTYSSSHKVYSATEKMGYVFQMKINDEAHHLTSMNMDIENTRKKYVNMLNIGCEKQLSLTATVKDIECAENDTCSTNIIISNNNVDYFGNVIDKRCLLWAINAGIVCDYVIQTIINDETAELDAQFTQFEIVEENDKRLFLSAFATLKSVYNGNSHHLLVYANSMQNSLKLVEYIKLLLANDYFMGIEDVYYSKYDSQTPAQEQKKILQNFEMAKYGIITCVYCLGEGWDFPLLDGVVFAENMSSNIRIVQSALRASRKNRNDDSKKTKIIVPVLNKKDWLDNGDNQDLKKVRQIIYQMGLEDETISQKIKVFKVSVEKQEEPVFSGGNKGKHGGSSSSSSSAENDIGICDNELLGQLILKTVHRRALDITYEKAKKIIAMENRVMTPDDYYLLCDRDNRLCKDPEIVYKGNFKGWVDYLSIPRIYYDFDTCREKVREHLAKKAIREIYANIDIETICSELCGLDNLFPPKGLWVDYYKYHYKLSISNLNEIIIIPKPVKKQKIVI